jgi:hypothetical protein
MEEQVGVVRVEVLDENGRSYVNWNKDNIVHVSIQDEGRTMKIFIDKNKLNGEDNNNSQS